MAAAVSHTTVAAGPNDPSKQVSSDAWNAAHTITGLATVASTGAYADLSGRPSLATVATSGLYSDLTGIPTTFLPSDGDKGDITVSSSGTAWAVDVQAITYAKIQNVSATSRFLGRKTAAAGVVEELTATDAKTILAIAEADVTGLVGDLALKAPLASPALTGVPVSTTAAVDTNTTQIATTAFVIAQAYAKLASPTFTGTLTAAALTATGLVTEAGEDSITAFATGGQTSATALSATKNLHRVSVCATINDSVKLPAALVGQAHYVRNDGAAACQVFGQATETINGVASATGISQGIGMGVWYVCTTAGAWTSSPVSTITASLDFRGSIAQAAVMDVGTVGLVQTKRTDTAATTYTAHGYDGTSAVIRMNSTGLLSWTNSSTTANTTQDVILARDGAGILALKNGNTAQESRIYAGNGGFLSNVKSVTESLTIAAAATTVGATSIPAGAILLAVSVRVTTVIPTAATFTYATTVGGTTLSTVATSTAATSTNAGTAAGASYRAAATTITITPNLTPGTATGVVRLHYYYLLVTPPTS